MNRIYRSAAVIFGLVASIIGLVAAAPDAFAMRLLDSGGSAPYAPPVTIVHSGASTWQVTVIAVGAAALAALATAVVLRGRGRTTKLSPAAG
jgi:hypothetical protein